ncbi:hypothetical protein J6590_071987 [Homalodisca vitripennis]|nr:hypothetical protein J6590_071987 [Homalodisca vitripennis]
MEVVCIFCYHLRPCLAVIRDWTARRGFVPVTKATRSPSLPLSPHIPRGSGHTALWPEMTCTSRHDQCRSSRVWSCRLVAGDDFDISNDQCRSSRVWSCRLVAVDDLHITSLPVSQLEV